MCDVTIAYGAGEVVKIPEKSARWPLESPITYLFLDRSSPYTHFREVIHVLIHKSIHIVQPSPLNLRAYVLYEWAFTTFTISHNVVDIHKGHNKQNVDGMNDTIALKCQIMTI